MLEKLKAKLSERANRIKDSSVNFLEDSNLKVPEAVREERLTICKSCPQMHDVGLCKLCGCYMPVKTYLSSSSCPLKKWSKIDVDKSTKNI
jgi:hypothetical protein